MNLLATQGQLGPSAFLIYIVVIAVAFYFLIFRPNKKQQTQFEQMLNTLKVGDDVITKSGVKGKVVDLDDVYFTLETGNGAQIQYVINALNYIVTPVDGVTEQVDLESEETSIDSEAEMIDIEDDDIILEGEEDSEENML